MHIKGKATKALINEGKYEINVDIFHISRIKHIVVGSNLSIKSTQFQHPHTFIILTDRF